MLSFYDVFVLVGETERQRFGKKERCVSKGMTEGVAVENSEEGVEGRQRVIPA